jgi:hypothetical protein
LPALVVCVGADVSSLRFVVLGGGAFPFGASCLLFGLEALSLRAGGLLPCCELGLFGVSAGRGCLVAVRGGCATLVEILGSLPPRRDSQDADYERHHDDDGADDSAGYEEWHSGSLG